LKNKINEKKMGEKVLFFSEATGTKEVPFLKKTINI